MQKLGILLAFIISNIMGAQSNYEQGMQKAFELWGTNPTEAANLFERIANAESENWLPAYYAAHVKIGQAFMEKDKDKLSALLESAQNSVNDATAISENNPEIMVMQALVHTAWIASDGMTYGPTLSPKVAAIYAQALQLAPDNPRVLFSKAEWDMGSARFFGQDTTPYCKDVERSLELFTTFKPESPFHPNWGKERAEQVLTICNK
jgi:hypothetical protein